MAGKLFEQIYDLVLKHALLNAVKYGGRARAEPVLGKVLGERPDLRACVKELIPYIEGVVRGVNQLKLDEQRCQLEERWPELLEEEKGPRPLLAPLPNVKRYKRVVTRFSPNPDCVLHLGNARALVLSYEYARMYEGLFLLRFEDTDPKTKRPEPEFYEDIREDMLWLGCEWDAEYRQSARLPIYYEYTRRLLEDGNAYVCACKRERFRQLALARQPCPCRNLAVEEALDRWDRMLEGLYREGEAIVRIKTDLNHPNPAVREWPALRIIDTSRYPHPFEGDRYAVWPLYNLACGLDDHLMEVTHIIRGKEHLTNEVRQRYLYMHLDWTYPETVHLGRLRVRDAVLSKSKIKEGVARGIYTGYDDPRLATLKALRQRGISAQAIRRLVLEIGSKPVDVEISWENLCAHNRKIVDPTANRYFFVADPAKMVIEEVEREYVAEIPLHPDYRERGYRSLVVKPVNGVAQVLIAKQDVAKLKPGQVIRLMGLFNAQICRVREVIRGVFHSEGVEEARKLKAPILHWLPVGIGVEATVVMPDGTRIRGLVEDECKALQPSDVIQFERFGFVRVDSVEPFVAFFSHT